jgi:geranylgeranyl diphosphate synthase type I
VLTSHLAELELALQAALSHGPSGLLSSARYVMGWENESGRPASASGKRIRPALCLYAADLLEASIEAAMPGAVAIELIHNFSLVHDEVQDHDAARHGRPTLWALLGEGQAINAGDFLIARAFDVLAAGEGPADAKVAAIRALNEAMSRMIAGQWADISFESRTDVTPEEYVAMIRGKTGALLGAPLQIGALLCGAPADRALALGTWGETVGLAFQVQDDILGIWGEPDLTGKSNTGDIERRKKTLPIIHGLASGAGEAIRAAYLCEGDIPGELIRDVVSALAAAGSREFCSLEAQRLVREADGLLDGLALPSEREEELRTIGNYLINRDA